MCLTWGDIFNSFFLSFVAMCLYDCGFIARCGFNIREVGLVNWLRFAVWLSRMHWPGVGSFRIAVSVFARLAHLWDIVLLVQFGRYFCFPFPVFFTLVSWSLSDLQDGVRLGGGQWRGVAFGLIVGVHIFSSACAWLLLLDDSVFSAFNDAGICRCFGLLAMNPSVPFFIWRVVVMGYGFWHYVCCCVVIVVFVCCIGYCFQVSSKGVWESCYIYILIDFFEFNVIRLLYLAETMCFSSNISNFTHSGRAMYPPPSSKGDLSLGPSGVVTPFVRMIADLTRSR